MAGLTFDNKLDEEIKRRKALIEGFPKVIDERIKSMGFKPGEIEIKIQQLDGLFVDIKRKQ